MAGDDPRVSLFESIRQSTEEGADFWSARDLAKVLGYTEWRNFTQAIKRAIEACENSDYAASDHFVDTNKMIAVGKGGQRNLKDVHLSRYACYLVIQNADPEKEIVALGQTYLAVQTRRQEMADQLAALSEAMGIPCAPWIPPLQYG
ncbi:MAG TPA: BRO family protein [Ktedonobacterales bacterium]|nr:BRO family protein [Ktedonobacterales bacterium]